MRLSELLRKDVVDEAGRRAGHVHDVRLVQDGPMTSGFDHSLRVQGLVVGRGAIANRLGYGRSGNRGPWLVRAIVEGRQAPKFVPWNRVRAIDADCIVISGAASDLEAIEPLPDPKGTTS
jgi:sporulation protein YlmC with PRC-barrel domain